MTADPLEPTPPTCGSPTPSGPCVLTVGHPVGLMFPGHAGHMSQTDVDDAHAQPMPAEHIEECALCREAGGYGVSVSVYVPDLKATDTIMIDMSYLMQPYLEDCVARGLPLPEGITVDDVTSWRDAHPDYDPSKFLNGQPVPDGIERANLDRAFRGPDLTEIVGESVGIMQAELVDVETVEPDARCLARTAAPTDDARRCTVHPAGAHECYEGPGHQGAKRSGRIGGLVPVVRPADPTRAPDWATHVCDCGFAWADVVQDRRPARSRFGGPGPIEAITVPEIEGGPADGRR